MVHTLSQPALRASVGPRAAQDVPVLVEEHIDGKLPLAQVIELEDASQYHETMITLMPLIAMITTIIAISTITMITIF